MATVPWLKTRLNLLYTLEITLQTLRSSLETILMRESVFTEQNANEKQIKKEHKDKKRSLYMTEY